MKDDSKRQAVFVAIGLAVGVAVGASQDKIAAGIIFGVILGIALAGLSRKRNSSHNDPDSTPEGRD